MKFGCKPQTAEISKPTDEYRNNAQTTMLQNILF